MVVEQLLFLLLYFTHIIYIHRRNHLQMFYFHRQLYPPLVPVDHRAQFIFISILYNLLLISSGWYFLDLQTFIIKNNYNLY